jgi:hypothetical protein
MKQITSLARHLVFTEEMCYDKRHTSLNRCCLEVETLFQRFNVLIQITLTSEKQSALCSHSRHLLKPKVILPVSSSKMSAFSITLLNFLSISYLIIGLCILLRVYQLNVGITSVSNKVFFGAKFYCALLTLHVSAPFGGHLQVVRRHKKKSTVIIIYSMDPLSGYV